MCILLVWREKLSSTFQKVWEIEFIINGKKDYISVNIQGQTLLCGTEIYSKHFGI